MTGPIFTLTPYDPVAVAPAQYHEVLCARCLSYTYVTYTTIAATHPYYRQCARCAHGPAVLLTIDGWDMSLHDIAAMIDAIIDVGGGWRL